MVYGVLDSSKSNSQNKRVMYTKFLLVLLKPANVGTTEERNYSEIQVLGNDILRCNYGLNLRTCKKRNS
jgi:hypothetical protein